MKEKKKIKIMVNNEDVTTAYVEKNNENFPREIIIKKDDDPVNHPSHYTFTDGYEVIDVINSWGMYFNLGNAIKYLARAGKKNPDNIEKTVQDLEKAVFYINYEIKKIIENGKKS